MEDLPTPSMDAMWSRLFLDLSDEELGAGRAYGGGEWLNAILRSVYGPEQAVAILRSGRL